MNDVDDKLTPLQALRAYCTQCLGLNQFSADHIKDCEGDHVNCAFFPYRLGKRPPIKVFRQFCIRDCMNGYQGLVSDCTIENCPNHPYRLGTNPARRGIGGMGNINNLSQKARESVKNELISL